MVVSDLHIHTHYSHGRDSVANMYRAALARGLAFLGFSEHSPRPEDYTYPKEYRDHLRQGFPSYVEEVLTLKDMRGQGLTVLLGMEMDWIGAERAFVQQAATAYAFDYLIGSVHFLDHWGFDATAKDWEALDEAARHAHYATYFTEVANMARSGLFQIAGHFDLIKIFSVHSFHNWLTDDNLDLVRNALAAIRDAGMAMEISSAGLRKPCAEIYPCPTIMRLAADLGVPITFCSDAHATDHVAHAFPQLAAYAAEYGHTTNIVFHGSDRLMLEF